MDFSEAMSASGLLARERETAMDLPRIASPP
jgi:hypothetical protein